MAYDIDTDGEFRLAGALAHGTTERHLEAILRGGLRPRKNRPSLWTEHPSVAANVYLTTAYASTSPGSRRRTVRRGC